MTDFKDPLQSGAVRFPRSGEQPRQLVVYLHGMGGTGNTNAWFVEALQDVMPHAVFYVPDGFEAMFGNEEARQWFAMPDHWKDFWFTVHPSKLSEKARRKIREMYDAYKPAAERVVAYVRERMAYHGIGPENTYIFGVSQGAMLAEQLLAESDALSDRREDGSWRTLGGAMIVAGCLMDIEEVEKHPSQSRPEFVLVHGAKDTTVPFRGYLLSDKTMFYHGQKTESKVVWGRDHTFFEKEAMGEILRLASRWAHVRAEG